MCSKETFNAEADIVTLLDSGAPEHVMTIQLYMRNLVRIEARKSYSETNGLFLQRKNVKLFSMFLCVLAVRLDLRNCC